jgi:hypothetical protein
VRGLLQDYFRFLARQPVRHILTALPPFVLSMALGFLTYETILSEGRWREWAGDASHWFYFEGMGYVTVLWLGPFAFLGVMASLETFDSLRPFGLFVVITGMRGLQISRMPGVAKKSSASGIS